MARINLDTAAFEPWTRRDQDLTRILSDRPTPPQHIRTQIFRDGKIINLR